MIKTVITIMKKIYSLITLKYFSISSQRKRLFRSSVFLFALLLCAHVYKAIIFPPSEILTNTLTIATLVLFFNIVFSTIRLFVVSSHRKRRNITSEEYDNFTVGTNALVNTATVIVAIIAVFIVFNIEFRSFLSSIALVAVALTIIFQDFIKNFLFGLAMMFSSDYEIGEYVQVGDMQRGVIVTITFSNVQIKTETGDLLFIPNTVIRSHEVTNFSKLKPKRINTELALLRTQITSVDDFEKALLIYLNNEFPKTIEVEKSSLQIKETNKDEVIFTLELPTKKASLKLKEQMSRTIQKFAIEYQSDSQSSQN